MYDATPRGRQPVIVDNRSQQTPQQQRSASVEVNVGVRSSGRRERSPSPATLLAELRRQDDEEERQRRRRRDERAARLAEELREERERRLREERRAMHDAEINARPPVPNPPVRRQSTLRPVVDQSERLHEMLSDMNLSARGERVIAEAVAERRRLEERERMLRAGIEAEDAEAQRQRLRRRFTIGRAPRRRDRVVYEDRSYRYD